MSFGRAMSKSASRNRYRPSGVYFKRVRQPDGSWKTTYSNPVTKQRTVEVRKGNTVDIVQYASGSAEGSPAYTTPKELRKKQPLTKQKQISTVQLQKTSAEPKVELQRSQDLGKMPTRPQFTQQQYNERFYENMPTEAERHKQLLDWGYSEITEDKLSQYEKAEGFVIDAYRRPTGEVRFFVKYDPDLWVTKQISQEKGISMLEAMRYVEKEKRERSDPLKSWATSLATVTTFENPFGMSTIMEVAGGQALWGEQGFQKASASIQLRRTREIANVVTTTGKLKPQGVAEKGLESAVMGGMASLGFLTGGSTTTLAGRSAQGTINLYKFTGMVKTGAGIYIGSKGYESATKGSVRGISQAGIGTLVAVSGVSDLKKGFFPKTQYTVSYPEGAKLVKKVGSDETYIEPIMRKQTFKTYEEAEAFKKSIPIPRSFRSFTKYVAVSEYGGEQVTGSMRGEIPKGVDSLDDLIKVNKLPADIVDDVVWSSARFEQRIGSKYAFSVGEPYIEGSVKFQDMFVNAKKIIGSTGKIGQSGVTTGGQYQVNIFERDWSTTGTIAGKPKGWSESLRSIWTTSKATSGGTSKNIFSRVSAELKPIKSVFTTKSGVENIDDMVFTESTRLAKEGEILGWANLKRVNVPAGVFSNLGSILSTSAVTTAIGSQLFFVPAQIKSNKPEFNTILQTKWKPTQAQFKEQLPLFESKQDQKQESQLFGSFGGSGGGITITQTVPVIPTVPILFGLGGELPSFWGKEQNILRQMKKQKKKYRQSLIAQVFNIRGKEPKMITGFGIRPIVAEKTKKGSNLKRLIKI